MVWTCYVVSVVLFARTWVAVEGSLVHIRGRLRYRVLDAASVRQFATCESGMECASSPCARLEPPVALSDESVGRA